MSSDIQSVRIGEISITCLPDGAANIDGHPYREDTDSGEEVDCPGTTINFRMTSMGTHIIGGSTTIAS